MVFAPSSLILAKHLCAPYCGVRPRINKMVTCMKPLKSLTLVAILLVSACASPTHDKMHVQASKSVPSTISVHNYRCESGETITANYLTTDSATITYKGSIYNLKIAVSGSGSRYVGVNLEWWTKRPDGTLLQHNADGTSGERIELCIEA